MGCHYSVNGVIPLKNDPGIEVAVEELCKSSYGFQEGVELEGLNLVIGINNGMSYSTALDLDDLLVEFAAKWASAPACIDTDCDGETAELLVGPEDCDMPAFRLKLLDEKIVALQEERTKLVARMEAK